MRPAQSTSSFLFSSVIVERIEYASARETPHPQREAPREGGDFHAYSLIERFEVAPDSVSVVSKCIVGLFGGQILTQFSRNHE